MISDDERPEEAPSSLADLSDAPQAEVSHADSGIPDEASDAFSRSRWRLPGFLAFLAGVLRDEDEARRLGSLILQLGIAGALIAVPISALGYIMLGSVAGYFAAGIGTGSTIAIAISVSGRLGRKKNR